MKSVKELFKFLCSDIFVLYDIEIFVILVSVSRLWVNCFDLKFCFTFFSCHLYPLQFSWDNLFSSHPFLVFFFHLRHYWASLFWSLEPGILILGPKILNGSCSVYTAGLIDWLIDWLIDCTILHCPSFWNSLWLHDLPILLPISWSLVSFWLII